MTERPPLARVTAPAGYAAAGAVACLALSAATPLSFAGLLAGAVILAGLGAIANAAANNQVAGHVAAALAEPKATAPRRHRLADTAPLRRCAMCPNPAIVGDGLCATCANVVDSVDAAELVGSQLDGAVIVDLAVARLRRGAAGGRR